MAAVMLNPGSYWVGNPKKVDPTWKPDFNATSYKAGPYTYFVFKYVGGYVGAIPKDALEYLKDAEVETGQFVTFDTETEFWEVNGNGKIGGIHLGILGVVAQEDLTEPKLKKAKTV
jgi:hypothetical protein